MLANIQRDGYNHFPVQVTEHRQLVCGLHVCSTLGDGFICDLEECHHPMQSCDPSCDMTNQQEPAGVAAGAKYVFHVASPCIMQAEDAEKAIVEPALQVCCLDPSVCILRPP